MKPRVKLEDVGYVGWGQILPVVRSLAEYVHIMITTGLLGSLLNGMVG